MDSQPSFCAFIELFFAAAGGMTGNMISKMTEQEDIYGERKDISYFGCLKKG